VKTATRQKLVHAALVAAIIWGAYNLFLTERRQPLGPVEVEAPAAMPVGSATQAHLDQTDLDRVAAAGWGYDPFRPAIKAVVEPTDNSKKDLKWVLSGIIYNERSPMAVINGRMVRTGDVINDARVVAIEPKSVLLERDGQHITLKVTKG